MGLKRRNPARTRLFTPQILAVPTPANTPAPVAPPTPSVSREERHRMIAAIAYGHAERSGFASDPVANWLLAEREVDSRLARRAS